MQKFAFLGIFCGTTSCWLHGAGPGLCGPSPSWLLVPWPRRSGADGAEDSLKVNGTSDSAQRTPQGPCPQAHQPQARHPQARVPSSPVLCPQAHHPQARVPRLTRSVCKCVCTHVTHTQTHFSEPVATPQNQDAHPQPRSQFRSLSSHRPSSRSGKTDRRPSPSEKSGRECWKVLLDRETSPSPTSHPQKGWRPTHLRAAGSKWLCRGGIGQGRPRASL